MSVSGNNIVYFVLFIFKAYSHAYLVDPKTTGQGRDGRYYPTGRMKKLQNKGRNNKSHHCMSPAFFVYDLTSIS
jgi:hypothetical protein